MKPGGWLLVTVSVAVGGALAWQWRSVQMLRIELATWEEKSRETEDFRRRNVELIQRQPADAEIERLPADRQALGRLRAEVETLQATTAKRAPVAGGDPATPPAIRPAASWRNVGRATPSAALETALWAAVGGDVDALAATIEFAAPARAKAEALLAGLPTDARKQYATAEELISLYTARDIPTNGTMRVVAERPVGDGEVRLNVLFEVERAPGSDDANGRSYVSRRKEFTVRRFGSDWKLVVPESAVERYGAMLAAPDGAGPSPD